VRHAGSLLLSCGLVLVLLFVSLVVVKAGVMLDHLGQEVRSHHTAPGTLP
jgi:hypothetical protein